MASENVAVMPDGVQIRYRLDGSSGLNAPLIVLSNPSLVDLTFWDEALALFLQNPQNTKYRILRYDNRGRSKHNEQRRLSLDILMEDICNLLDTIKVAKAAAVIGISLGGLTAVNLALKHPERVVAIMPCDFYPKSPPDQVEIWESRVEVARQDKTAPVDAAGARLLGEVLAEATVKRWLAPTSVHGGISQAKLQRVIKLVSENRLDGFINIVHAISSYNLEKDVPECKVLATFVAGECDDAAKYLKEMAPKYGKGVDVQIIRDAGHLPVLDQPERFTDIMTKFLEVHVV
ncbi:hypothetical protein H2200_012445 [Cladophialophora chaetospira]|uniref:AB hydrolase-1 domain-containing protein n=1 Tax=Cladophialophora chaetospira TaxID=386627 RepID=A0AA38WXW1_9EURO|nr:hypothetical protein H2200_012445 [Cladophialophora chaetospira]